MDNEEKSSLTISGSFFARENNRYEILRERTVHYCHLRTFWNSSVTDDCNNYTFGSCKEA